MEMSGHSNSVDYIGVWLNTFSFLDHKNALFIGVPFLQYLLIPYNETVVVPMKGMS